MDEYFLRWGCLSLGWLVFLGLIIIWSTNKICKAIDNVGGLKR